MQDSVFESFLEMQCRDSSELSAKSDIVQVVPVAGDPPSHYLAEFRCTGLVDQGGLISEAEKFVVGIRFDPGYLRGPVDVAGLLMWLSPATIFHPNISPPFICIGAVHPGTRLVELLYRVYELITWDRFTPREDDALCRSACVWARRNLHRVPVDSRPLIWRNPESSSRPGDGA